MKGDFFPLHADDVMFLFLFFFPAENASVSSGRVRTCEVHRVGAACCWALADVAVVFQREEHEVIFKVVLPEEYFGIFLIGREAYIAWHSFAIDFDVSAVHAFQ